ncbi:hypothetical protein LTR85_001008 [Meristemomyces frigidus]|nr:hypothetical protein LTR85_001008 [Meristemomyces frigidus]
MAVSQVFDTTELLEAIVTELQPVDLLRGQRVCKKWRAVIQRSDTMQRKLFLKARASERVIELRNTPTNGQWFWVCERDRLTKITDMSFKPFFDLLFRRLDEERPRMRQVDFLSHTAAASWKTMYLTVPPLASILVGLHYEATERGFAEENIVWYVVRAQDGIGVRMGDVVGVVQEKTTRARYKRKETVFFDSRIDAFLPCLRGRR